MIARYRVGEGNEAAVRGLLTKLAAATRTEPGNVSFVAYAQLEDDRDVVLLERYASREAFAAQTSHFKELVLEQILPLLEGRVIETYDANDR